jgi:hypothetical protein
MSYQFLPGRRFRWGKTNYQVKSILSAGEQVRLEDLFTGERKNVAVAELIQAFFKGNIRFEIQGKQARPAAGRATHRQLFPSPQARRLFPLEARQVSQKHFTSTFDKAGEASRRAQRYEVQRNLQFLF